MKILVYGATGSLGKKFLESKNFLKELDEIIIGKADITDILSIGYDLKYNPDIIINFAGMKNCGYKFHPKLFDVNVTGVLNLLHASDLDIPVICMGSIAALTPEYSMYAMSKKHLEDIAIFNKRLKIIRLPGVFSLNRLSGAIYEIFINCLNNKDIVINSDLQYWNCISDETVIFSLIKHLDFIIDNKTNLFNMGYLNRYTLSDVAEIMKEELKSKSNIIISKQPVKFEMDDVSGIYLKPFVSLEYDLIKYVNAFTVKR